jgi:putative oxidoreductase
MSMKRKSILEIIYTLLIILFVYTASSKLVNIRETYAEIDKQPFPEWMTPYLVWIISLSELLVSALLLFKKTHQAGLWGALILMLLFTGYIGAILLNYFPFVPCSCGGVISQLGWQNHLYFNLCFVLISMLGLVLYTRHPTEYDETQNVIIT